MKAQSHIGVIGMGVMGASLAQNFASKQTPTSVYNHHPDKVRLLLKKSDSPYLSGYDSLKTFVKSLTLPRVMLLMVPAGEPVDMTLTKLLPLLSKGDIVIDGGNSFYRDTMRRTDLLNKKGVHFVGAGVSGGEQGALHGPSIMVSCGEYAWRHIKPLLEKIAARDFKGKPCVANLGGPGAGHYVKMVHNGIEYALMQLIAESYGLLKNLYQLSNQNTATVFETYNSGRLGSYLLEIVMTVLEKKEGKKDLVDLILDVSGNKGTGKWTTQEALDLGLALPIITESLFARYISSEKKLRQVFAKGVGKKKMEGIPPLTVFLEMLEPALYGAFLLTYSEGFMMLDRANSTYKFNLNFQEVARIWQGGCIIRAKVLKNITTTLTKKSGILLTDKKYLKEIISCMDSLKNITITGAITETPIATYAAALNSFYAMTSERLPANIIQGMRDLFGAHTYERIDKKGSFHTDWQIL